MTEEIECVGACDQHVGEVYLVEVRGVGWTNQHHYCQTARDADRANGLVVDAVEPVEAERSAERSTWRTGRKVPNTLYHNDTFVGSCVTPEFATMLVAKANETERREALAQACQDAVFGPSEEPICRAPDVHGEHCVCIADGVVLPRTAEATAGADPGDECTQAGDLVCGCCRRWREAARRRNDAQKTCDHCDEPAAGSLCRKHFDAAAAYVAPARPDAQSETEMHDAAKVVAACMKNGRCNGSEIRIEGETWLRCTLFEIPGSNGPARERAMLTPSGFKAAKEQAAKEGRFHDATYDGENTPEQVKSIPGPNFDGNTRQEDEIVSMNGECSCGAPEGAAHCHLLYDK